jgi:hypothetical protein
MGDQTIERFLPSQNKTDNGARTYIHAPSGIRTSDSSVPAVLSFGSVGNLLAMFRLSFQKQERNIWQVWTCYNIVTGHLQIMKMLYIKAQTTLLFVC